MASLLVDIDNPIKNDGFENGSLYVIQHIDKGKGKFYIKYNNEYIKVKLDKNIVLRISKFLGKNAIGMYCGQYIYYVMNGKFHNGWTESILDECELTFDNLYVGDIVFCKNNNNFHFVIYLGYYGKHLFLGKHGVGGIYVIDQNSMKSYLKGNYIMYSVIELRKMQETRIKSFKTKLGWLYEALNFKQLLLVIGLSSIMSIIIVKTLKNFIT